jgi:hypothetical protein
MAGVDGLRQRRAGAVAQNISQRIDKSSWLAELAEGDSEK